MFKEENNDWKFVAIGRKTHLEPRRQKCLDESVGFSGGRMDGWIMSCGSSRWRRTGIPHSIVYVKY